MKPTIRLIDVGARGGIDPRWKAYYDALEVLAFEPDPKECATLNARQYPYPIRYLPVALGAHDGEQATLHLCKQPGCSSLLLPNMQLCDMYSYNHALEIVGRRPLTLNRMDTVCGDFPADVLKIDTQGTELDVLQGAGLLLDTLLAVELEVEFVPLYVGQPLFADIDAFMRGKGFTLRGIRRTYWRTRSSPKHAYGGQLIHGDALYLRPDAMNCPKGHIVLAAYRQYDLLAHFGATHMIPDHKLPLPLRLMAKLLAGYPNRELRRFVDRLRPADATDWHDPDFF